MLIAHWQSETFRDVTARTARSRPCLLQTRIFFRPNKRKARHIRAKATALRVNLNPAPHGSSALRPSARRCLLFHALNPPHHILPPIGRELHLLSLSTLLISFPAFVLVSALGSNKRPACWKDRATDPRCALCTLQARSAMVTGM